MEWRSTCLALVQHVLEHRLGALGPVALLDAVLIVTDKQPDVVDLVVLALALAETHHRGRLPVETKASHLLRMGHVLVGVNVGDQLAVGTVAGVRGARGRARARRVRDESLPELRFLFDLYFDRAQELELPDAGKAETALKE